MVIPRGRAASKTGYESFEIVADSKRNRKAWLKARESGLGASEVAAIFGVNPWESPFTLYQKKRGELPPEPESEPMEWGKRLEAVVAQAFSEKTKRKTWEHPLGGMLLRSKEHPWLLATPDYEQRAKGFATDGLLECKTAGAQFLEDWKEDVPVYYQIQVQQQLLVTNRKYASVACLIGGQQFKYKHVARNAAFLKKLVEKTRTFWHMVEIGEPPPVDASDSTIDTLKQMKADGRIITLPKDVLVWHDKLVLAAEERKKFEEEEKMCKNTIASLLGTASRGLMPNGEGMYKFEKRAAYAVKAHEVAETRLLKFTRRTDV
jgi:putative phage-type endonuclease